LLAQRNVQRGDIINAQHWQPFGIYARYQSRVSPNIRISIMSSHMPPVPPANRKQKGGRGDPKVSQDKSVKHEHHANSAEEGETANIKQNTTNKGFFRGRRLG
jgi:hypothetical protein